MIRKALWIGLACLALAGVLGVLTVLEDTADVETAAAQQPLRQVTVITAQIGAHTGSVSVFAEVTPRWQVDLRSRVSGIVSDAVPVALAGSRVSKGDVLLQLEDAPYVASLSDARSVLENAQFELRKKKNKHTIALKDWRAVNPDRQPPEMAVHIPEVRVAERAVSAAEARVAAADYDLSSTLLRAPFPAIVTKRNVSPGATVNEGDVLFSVLDDSLLDIQASVGARDWSLLNRNWQSLGVTVYSDTDQKIGTAKVRQGGGFLDPQSRKYQLFLEVERATETAILPGAFVRVNLPGRALEQTLRIPESALTQNGFVWFLDDTDRLQRFEARPLFRDNGAVVVRVPDFLRKHEDFRVVSLPMSAYLPGQKVEPVKREAGQ
ncbi:efflux RND transporter periplasmic adaptor subunit [Labrenzia sp. PHM005]|uniref:efflux RND transporter periplasmic adaptor subunit n=1 Tax=Labrenzia sp. PHM005 TaxID=2590016 RepID=UPI0011405B31|nr:efflux RND transporter periplasmic adaptor subunit [Labrenzia sp. PHM005]QDG76240.1 efflux RND transporter periplasmic adaptor subunit [Labrenzia sp. PHM005]